MLDIYVCMTQVGEEDIPPLPPPVSPPSQPPVSVPGGCQQLDSCFKRKLFQQNKGSRREQKKQVKLCLSAREVARLENGEMLNDTHIDIANQLLKKQFPDVRGLS